MANHQEVFILQHVANEGAGTLASFMRQRGIAYRTLALYDDQPLPKDTDQVRAALIMGGPMNVYEEDKYPFLTVENLFIKKLIDKDIPTLGVCLGSQLIAKALGSRVYRAPAEEVGWSDITLSEAARQDVLFSRMPYPAMRVLQWHGDTFDIPRGATLLAQSPVVPHQAYRYKNNIYALQYHIEVDEPMLQDWFKDSPAREPILAEYDSYKDTLLKITNQVYSQFFNLPA